MTEQLRASPPHRYEEISRRLLEQARQELDAGDILQASEKVWGATAHYIKAVAQEKGWNHHFHNHIRDAANYIGFAYNRRDLLLVFRSLEALHGNFYEHQTLESDVRDELDAATRFIAEMSELRRLEIPERQDHLSPNQAADQERRLRSLTTKTPRSHGEVYSEDELAVLPPVAPASTD